jgi:hypothetical protein
VSASFYQLPLLVLIYAANTLPLAHHHGLHFKSVQIALSAISTGLCCIIVGFLSLGHLTSFVKPEQQKQYVRVQHISAIVLSS